MERNKKRILRKYYIFATIVGIIYFSICYSVFLITGNYNWSFLLFLTLIVPYQLAIRAVTMKTIHSVLLNKLDAPLYNEIVRNHVGHFTNMINGGMAIGDYVTAINLAVCVLQSKRSTLRTKHTCLYVLARAYFELRDFEKLKLLCDKYEEYKKAHPKRVFLKKPNLVWAYYRHFLEQNYEECKAVCEKRTAKNKNNRYFKLQNDFYYAVACYENGDIEKATEGFTAIIDIGPKTNLANLSNRYIEAIEIDSQLSLSEWEIIPNTDAAKTIRRRQVIFQVVLWVLILFFITMSAVDLFEEKHYREELAQFESALNDALDERYDDATFLKYFYVEKDGEHIDTLGLVDSGKGLDLVNMTSSDGGQTLELILFEKDIVIDKYYCKESIVCGYYIGFTVSPNEVSGDEYYNVEKFELKGKTYWLCIDYIEETPSQSIV